MELFRCGLILQEQCNNLGDLANEFLNVWLRRDKLALIHCPVCDHQLLHVEHQSADSARLQLGCGAS